MCRAGSVGVKIAFSVLFQLTTSFAQEEVSQNCLNWHRSNLSLKSLNKNSTNTIAFNQFRFWIWFMFQIGYVHYKVFSFVNRLFSLKNLPSACKVSFFFSYFFLPFQSLENANTSFIFQTCHFLSRLNSIGSVVINKWI